MTSNIMNEFIVSSLNCRTLWEREILKRSELILAWFDRPCLQCFCKLSNYFDDRNNASYYKPCFVLKRQGDGLASVVIEPDSSHIPGHYQWLEEYSVTRSYWNLYMTRLTRLDSNPKMRPNDSTRPILSDSLQPCALEENVFVFV